MDFVMDNFRIFGWLCIMLAGCNATTALQSADSELDCASIRASNLPNSLASKYARNRSWENLRSLTCFLQFGMSLDEVHELLGPADYSPIEGQYYYSADQVQLDEISGEEVVLGLIIEFRSFERNEARGVYEFRLTDVLQRYSLRPIRE